MSNENIIDYKKIKEELDNCQNPVFFYDDDPDGFSSFVQLYKYKGEGEGYIVKDSPKLKRFYFNFVDSHDKIFILDKPMVDEEFFEEAARKKIRVVWIDHHEPQDISQFNNVIYFNPKLKSSQNICTSWICYNAIKKNLWIAMIGIIGDWLLPIDLRDKLIEEYPRLIDKRINKPDQALFNTNIGKLIAIVSFNLKGNSKSIKKSINDFLKIKDPYELLDNSSEAAREIIKKYNKINEVYQKHLELAKKQMMNNENTSNRSHQKDQKKNNMKNSFNETNIVDNKNDFLVYIYNERRYSFTKELSNNLLFLFPNSFIVVGRENNGLIKMSLRSKKNVAEILKESLKGIKGYGGGHKNACGSQVDIRDFKKFIDNLKKNIKLKN